MWEAKKEAKQAKIAFAAGINLHQSAIAGTVSVPLKKKKKIMLSVNFLIAFYQPLVNKKTIYNV